MALLASFRTKAPTWSSNLRSTFLCSKYAIPHLRKTRGSIINISSMVGLVGCSVNRILECGPETPLGKVVGIPGGTFHALSNKSQTEEFAIITVWPGQPAYVNGHNLVVDGGWTAGFNRDF